MDCLRNHISKVERVETIQNYEKFGIMNLILETVTSKKSLKLTLQQVIQRVKTEEDSSFLPKLAAYLSLGASIHQICKSPRPELKDLIQLIYDKIATDDENKNCDVDLLSSFNDMLSNMKKSVGI